MSGIRSIRAEIKQKIKNDLARELLDELDVAEEHHHRLLESSKFQKRLDDEAEYYLDILQKTMIDSIFREEIGRIEASIGDLQNKFQDLFRREVDLILQILLQSNTTYSFSNDIQSGIDDIKGKEHLKKLIANNEIEQALFILLQSSKSGTNEVYNEIVVHYSNVKRLATECRIGKISREVENLERNKINHALLELLDKVSFN